mmetsp:Transcript_51807/g.121637  ORF Transcript_51807/g.121637 Transcript_51807/m.121637 type:complete len:216 (+) Transcript_51807:775-1422(+)
MAVWCSGWCRVVVFPRCGSFHLLAQIRPVDIRQFRGMVPREQDEWRQAAPEHPGQGLRWHSENRPPGLLHHLSLDALPLWKVACAQSRRFRAASGEERPGCLRKHRAAGLLQHTSAARRRVGGHPCLRGLQHHSCPERRHLSRRVRRRLGQPVAARVAQDRPGLRKKWSRAADGQACNEAVRRGAQTRSRCKLREPLCCLGEEGWRWILLWREVG